MAQTHGLEIMVWVCPEILEGIHHRGTPENVSCLETDHPKGYFAYPVVRNLEANPMYEDRSKSKPLYIYISLPYLG